LFKDLVISNGCLTSFNQLTANDANVDESDSKRTEEIAEKYSLLNQSITDLSSKIQHLSLNNSYCP